jgi:hypothetical protein
MFLVAYMVCRRASELADLQWSEISQERRCRAVASISAGGLVPPKNLEPRRAQRRVARGMRHKKSPATTEKVTGLRGAPPRAGRGATPSLADAAAAS